MKRYGNDIRTVKNALGTASVIGAFALIAGVAILLRKGDLSHVRWSYLIVVTLAAPVAILAVTVPSMLFKVEIENGVVKQRVAGFVVSTGLVADFEKMSIGSTGPCIVFKKKRMHLIAMHLREVKRLSDDLHSIRNFNDS